MMMNNLFDLTGKVALVTGGNGGLGLGIARGLASAGARLAIVGRNPAKTSAACGEIAVGTLGLVADVSREDEVAAAIEATLHEFGRLDILVNNAGISVRKPPQDLSLEEWRNVLDVNLTSAFLMSRAAYPSLKAAGGGKIINIGSLNSLFGSPYATAYAASKGGIVQLTKSLALSWAADNIQVNCILPGWFDTDLTAQARAYVPDLNERVLARVPVGRWGKAEEIAGTAIWLSSAASNFVTGASVPVDGGCSVAP
jgi:2-dehydro-3-deoxy-D-gluconate 5-dehydrogenase